MTPDLSVFRLWIEVATSLSLGSAKRLRRLYRKHYMPRYSPGKIVHSVARKKLWDINWAEAHDIFREVQENLVAEKQAIIDEKYRLEIAELEQEYAETHEAPYEGNFSDQIAKKEVRITADELEKAMSTNLRAGFIEKHKLVYHIDWLMPQIITYLGNLPTFKDEEGKLCGLQFRNNNFKTPSEKGLYRFLMVNERSSYLKTQYKAPYKEYCALVPLILYAQRLVNRIPYSAWSKETLRFIVNSDLCDAMLCEVPSVTRDELINIRSAGLATASGQVKSPVSTHMLFGKEQAASVIGDLPKLSKVMLTQIWCAHPDNRSRYMVLNPKNWDTIPPPLIETEVTKPTTEPTKLALFDDF